MDLIHLIEHTPQIKRNEETDFNPKFSDEIKRILRTHAARMVQGSLNNDRIGDSSSGIYDVLAWKTTNHDIVEDAVRKGGADERNHIVLVEEEQSGHLLQAVKTAANVDAPVFSAKLQTREFLPSKVDGGIDY